LGGFEKEEAAIEEIAKVDMIENLAEEIGAGAEACASDSP